MKPVNFFSRRILSAAIALLAIIAGVAILTQPVQAQTQPTPSDDQVNAIASQLYCPVCEDIPLDVCMTPACMQWRELIRQQLAQGKTPDQIKEYFTQQYGERVLAVPKPGGLNWVLYLLPPVILVAALIFMIHFIHAHRPAAGEPDLTSNHRDENTEDLHKKEGQDD